MLSALNYVTKNVPKRYFLQKRKIKKEIKKSGKKILVPNFFLLLLSSFCSIKGQHWIASWHRINGKKAVKLILLHLTPIRKMFLSAVTKKLLRVKKPASGRWWNNSNSKNKNKTKTTMNNTKAFWSATETQSPFFQIAAYRKTNISPNIKNKTFHLFRLIS